MTATLKDCGKTEAELLALPLSNGTHGARFIGECCLVEKSNRIATCVPAFRERFGAASKFTDDHPSISRVVRAMAIGLNDMRWESDDARTAALDRFTISILGTATTPEDEETRAWMATDWLARVQTPAWLRLAGLVKEAEALVGCARIVDATTAGAAQPRLEEARTASAVAWDTAWAAARDAASAVASAVARDAASAVAWDAASAVASAVAWDTAWAAASAVAWDTAWAAARDAASAVASAVARDAASAVAWAAASAVARDAASAALAPTALALRPSAIELLDAMIAVGSTSHTEA